ncbi:PQQ-dependent sugar dehydrogenase [Candidatus Binatia bacterium]|nr:PQQ-dependent sugar dehydrogenase [Candidatus Binatia bacterium]
MRRPALALVLVALGIALPVLPAGAAETCERAGASFLVSIIGAARTCLTKDVPAGRSCTRRNRGMERRAELVTSLCASGTVERLTCTARQAILAAGLPYAAMTGTGFGYLCTTTSCGNGVTEPPEQCDDANVIGGDGCSAICQLEGGACTDVCAGIVPVTGTSIRAERVATGLSQPVFVVAPPRDTTRVFIVEKTGRIRILKFGTLLPTAFLDLAALISGGGEQGLLGLAFHPSYADNGRFFVNYTDTDGDTVVAEYRVSANPDIADAGSQEILLQIDQPFDNHNGGQVSFGPDGFLYIGTGDGGSGGDPMDNAENIDSHLGKLLRIDVDNGTTYVSPPTNPFFGAVPGLDEIWAYGLRNPWRFSFDRLNGDLYIGDVGQGSWEEIDWRPGSSTGGENYGWDVMEGLHCFEPPSACTQTGLTMPVLEYDHGQGCSVTGGYVYRGCKMPDLAGTYFYADYCTEFVRTLTMSGGVATNLQDRTAELESGGVSIDAITSFGEDARGEIYITDQGGEVFKIVPGP